MFEEVEARRARLDSRRPFDADTRRKLDDVFKPWFIFSSNAIEGNTLTLGDTIYLLREHRLPAGKTEEEYLEVKGQEAAYEYLQQAVAGGFQLSEKLVREFHQLLTEKLDTAKYEPGRYKTRDNQVLLADGTAFPYVPAIDTPAAMQALLEWYAADGQKLHPIERAAALHYRFILIHPFLDGNGRTARMLANLVLLQSGYALVVFRADGDRRRVYFDALRAVDTSVPQGELAPGNGQLNFFPFVSYLEQELLWSYDQALDVVEGRLAVTVEDLVRRFEKFDERVLSSRGISNDEQTRAALLANRAAEALGRVHAQAWRFVGNVKSQLVDIGLRTEITQGDELDTFWCKLLGLDQPPRRGNCHFMHVNVVMKHGAPISLSIPPNLLTFLVFAEPHRLLIATTYFIDRHREERPPRMPLPLDAVSWAPLDTFVTQRLQTFLDELEGGLAAGAPPTPA